MPDGRWLDGCVLYDNVYDSAGLPHTQGYHTAGLLHTTHYTHAYRHRCLTVYETGLQVKHRIPECDLNTAYPLHEAGSTVPGAGFQGLRRQRSVVISLSEREKAPSQRALNRQLVFSS